MGDPYRTADHFPPSSPSNDLETCWWCWWAITEPPRANVSVGDVLVPHYCTKPIDHSDAHRCQCLTRHANESAYNPDIHAADSP
jgi:hypothetical protein